MLDSVWFTCGPGVEAVSEPVCPRSDGAEAFARGRRFKQTASGDEEGVSRKVGRSSEAARAENVLQGGLCIAGDLQGGGDNPLKESSVR